MSKQPFMPLFFGDFLAATSEWSGEERALYLLLLSYQWSLGSLPTDSKRLAKLVDYERRVFDEHWSMVSKKFVERDERLYNLRLETHRERSIELGNKRSTAGKTGAAKRWQADSNSHAVANGKDDGKPMAIAKDLLCHPSHPIPSHPIPESPSASAQDQEVSELRARVRPETGGVAGTGGGAVVTATELLTRAPALSRPRDSMADPHEVTERCKAAYPPGTYTGVTWIHAERCISKLLEDGATGEELVANVVAYRAQIDAKGDVGTQFVKSPKTFFAEGHWRGPFPMPAAGTRAGKKSFAERMAPLYAAGGNDDEEVA